MMNVPLTPETAKCLGPMVSDETLLAAFARTGEQSAFRELTKRHVGWVYAAALRQMHDQHMAEDAVQAVFFLLCQRAKNIAGGSSTRKVSGWLFMVMNYTVRAMMRAQRRRQHHERQAALQRLNLAIPPELPSWTEDLDAAVERLGAPDRSAVLLRFYQGLEFAEVARGLGVSEDAARKRVTRAVGKLRASLGATCTNGSLAIAVTHGLPLSTAVLEAKVAASALAGVGGAALSIGSGAAVKGAVFLMAMTKAKIAVGVVVIVVLAGSLVMPITVKRLRQNPPEPQMAMAAATQAAVSPVADGTQPAVAPSLGMDAAPGTFEHAYALKAGQVLGRIPPPFDPARLAFYTASFPDQARSIPRGSDAMFVTWKDGKTQIDGMIFGGPYSVRELAEKLLKIPEMEVEGEGGLDALKLTGDFVYRADATAEELRGALAALLSAECRKPLTVTLHEVERTVTVLQGKWNYTAVPGSNRHPNYVEIYGRDLESDPMRGGRRTVTLDELAAWIGRWLIRQVIIEATDAPASLQLHENPIGDGSLESKLKAHDAETVLNRVQEQTGLKWSQQLRKVRRLVIESPKG